MRCSICDYSNSMPSLFNSGLVSSCGYRKLYNIGGDTICFECAQSYYDESPVEGEEAEGETPLLDTEFDNE